MRMARLNVTRKATLQTLYSKPWPRDLATLRPTQDHGLLFALDRVSKPLYCNYIHCKYLPPQNLLGKDHPMNKFEYIIEEIDGDYAHLRRTDTEALETGADQEHKLVARALLPPEIAEGTRLLYEWMQYSILES